jgi:hypothetical protein
MLMMNCTWFGNEIWNKMLLLMKKQIIKKSLYWPQQKTIIVYYHYKETDGIISESESNGVFIIQWLSDSL